MMDRIRFTRAEQEDLADYIGNFLIALDTDELVGVVGLEIREHGALVRSLAVAESRQGEGIGRELCRRIVEYARSKNVQELGLLTTTAERFFAREGFEKREREFIPEYVKDSLEFRLSCPSSAVFMLKRID